RRHTRWPRDWSSDVCSSDLAYEDIDKLKQGEQLYQRAVELDPKFALAFARYSQLESWIVHTFENSPARREKARSLAERSLQLQRSEERRVGKDGICGMGRWS